MLRRCSAAFLLLVFVADIGFHLLSPLFAVPQETLSTQITAAPGHQGIAQQHGPDCGIPGHSGTPFHHHHFPAIVTHTASVLPEMGFAWMRGTLAPEAVYVPLLPSTVRAPPLS